jgi:hypothetical protein
MSTHDCSICHEPATLGAGGTGLTTLACGHEFHFRCLATWFYTQQAQSSCPCCRREVSHLEDVPLSTEFQAPGEEDDDESEYSDDEESEYDDEETLVLMKRELDDILKNILGGTGVSEGIWRRLFPGTEEEYSPDCAVSFSRTEMEDFATLQGGRVFRDEEWEILVERWGSGDAEILLPQVLLAQGLAAAENPLAAIEPDGLFAAPAATQQPIPSALKIHWVRRPDGDWVRQIEDGAAGGGGPPPSPALWGVAAPAAPPDELVDQTMSAAKKLQAVWRGYRQRIRYQVVAGLLRLAQSATA